eukprot:8865908-Pyramimonas_sp.AAC.1
MVLERLANSWKPETSMPRKISETILGVHLDTEKRRHEDLLAMWDKAKAAFFRDAKYYQSRSISFQRKFLKYRSRVIGVALHGAEGSAIGQRHSSS